MRSLSDFRGGQGGSLRSGCADAFALRGVEVTLNAAAIAFVVELRAFFDAVLAGEVGIAEANEGSDLRAGVAGWAFAEVEVRIRGLAIGNVAAA